MNLRLVFACVLAIAVGLPTSVVSVAKGLTIVAAVLLLLWPSPRGPADHAVGAMQTPFAVVAALLFLSLSLLWTTVPMDQALESLAKHGKLLLVPVLIMLLRTRREALIALSCFVGVQLVQLLSSWLSVAGVPLPWATSNMASTYHTVFHNYLHQSIMMVVLAAVCWHLRGLLARPWMRAMACVVCALALANTLFMLPGRTGHVLAVVLISLAIAWQLPRRLRYAGVLLPFVVGGMVMLGSESVRHRAAMVADETIAFNSSAAANKSSSGERLNYWQRSAALIAERPLTGFGLGSFNQEYRRVDAGRANPATYNVRNPHQEFLLWGVEGGIGAMVALGLLLTCMLRDARRGEPQCARASVSVVIALVVSCLFNSALFDAPIGDFLCVILGLTMALGLRSLPSTAPAASQSLAGAVTP